MVLRRYFRLLLNTKDHFIGLPVGAFAAQLSLRFLLAFFPAVLVMVTLLGFWFEIGDVIPVIVDNLHGVIPDEVLILLMDNVQSVLAETSLSVFSIGFAVLLYGVVGLIRDLMKMLNMIYEVEKPRVLWQNVLIAILLLIGGFVLLLLIAQALFFTETLIGFLAQANIAIIDVNLLFWRWPVMGLLIFIFIYASYVFIPNEKKHYWRWNLPGAIIFTLGWFIMSLLFNYYVANFANYNQTYGVLGTIILLLFYLQLSSYLYIICAVINSRIIHQHEKLSLWQRLKSVWQ